MEYYAHRDGERAQRLSDHLRNTARIAECFADAFGAGAMGRLAGLMHDAGKYSPAFQRRLAGSAERVDHSTPGACEAFRRCDAVTALCIAGHHDGIPDLGSRNPDAADSATLYGRILRGGKNEAEPYDAFSEEIKVPECTMPARFQRDNRSLYFYTKMLFSCLVDADLLDTEAFYSHGPVQRGNCITLKEMQERLNRHVAEWKNPEIEMNRRRWNILQSLRTGGGDRGLYSLTVPTGGGKTVSSVAFALEHALKNHMSRVIYIIPYTGIIEDTQDVFERIFGTRNVVTHYSDVQFQCDENEAETDRRRLSAENWDAPLILTTARQFFESVFSNKPSACRKLHSIAGSVLIFDEAQMLPPPFLRPCAAAIAELVRNYGCSAVLCSAALPSLEPMISEFLPGYSVRELCPEREETYQAFRRVRYVQEGLLSDAEAAEVLSEERQVLCIVNSRAQAQRIFGRLPKDGAYHLSTAMTPHDRRETLAVIRQRLAGGDACRVVSTGLVEAGVDVDFPTVYRSISGIDSMLQAGGRCNREGKRGKSESIVHLFETEETPPEMLRQNIDAAQHVLRSYSDIASPSAIKAYFNFLYYIIKDQEALDSRNVLSDIQRGELAFASISERFRIIEDGQFTVFVPLEEAEKLIEALRGGKATRTLLRKLGPYAVGVTPGLFSDLLQRGAIERVSENAGILADMSLYRRDTGLALSGEESGEVLSLAF